jgi:hypothetical protein
MQTRYFCPVLEVTTSKTPEATPTKLNSAYRNERTVLGLAGIIFLML